jgi:DNA repair exonuclease SbcCD nuclease subunit
VHIAAGPDPVRIAIRDRDGVVLGRITAIGHAHSRVADDLSQRFPPVDGTRGVPEVAVLHTQVVGSRGSDAHDRYAPSELDTLIRSGHSYWALGHVHGRQSLAESPRICYPGTPQGLSIREAGARGVLLVDVAGPDRCTTEFVETGPVRWEVAEIRDPVEETTLNALLRRIEREWRTRRDADPGTDSTDWLLRLRIRGRAALAAELGREDGIETLRSEVRTALGLLDVEVITHALVTPVAWEDHLRRPDVLGEALRLVGEFRNDSGAPWFDPSALAGGGRALDPAELASYVESLLDGAEAHVADRLLRETESE